MCKWSFSFLHRRKVKQLPPPGDADSRLPELSLSTHAEMALPLPESHPNVDHASALALVLPGPSVSQDEPESTVLTQPPLIGIEQCSEQVGNTGVAEPTEGPDSGIPAHPLEAGSPSSAGEIQEKTGIATASQAVRSVGPDDSKTCSDDRVRYFSRPEYVSGADEVEPFLAPDLLFPIELESDHAMGGEFSGGAGSGSSRQSSGPHS